MKKAGSSSDRIRTRGGRLTLPKRLVSRVAHKPEETTFVVKPMGEGLFVVPEEKLTPFLEAALEFRQEVDAAGVTLEDLLEGLNEEKARYTREVYGG